MTSLAIIGGGGFRVPLIVHALASSTLTVTRLTLMDTDEQRRRAAEQADTKEQQKFFEEQAGVEEKSQGYGH